MDDSGSLVFYGALGEVLVGGASSLSKDFLVN